MRRFLLALVTCTTMCAIVPTNAEVLTVDGGEISGTEISGVNVYRSVPYAAPPVGELRWREPQPVEQWEGIRSCTEFGPICPQLPYPAASIYVQPDLAQSEDCLYLNVWTTAQPGDLQPVMVWIHGGALTRGAGSLPNYDGTNFARKGVVLVTINYRLNVFGFMAHPDLTAESPNASSGNYGLLDQVAALEWIQRNISQFGGDPENVTVFGESAGSWSVHFLMASPLARGLFHRAIGQSGAAFAGDLFLSVESGSSPPAESGGIEIASAAGVRSLEELRALSAAELLSVYEGLQEGSRFRATPNIDGYLLEDTVLRTFQSGRFNHVPVIVGSNANEMTSLTDPRTIPASREALDAWVAKEFGTDADEYYERYPVEGPTGVRDSYLDALRDRWFALGMRTWARLNEQHGQNAYLYHFEKVPPRAGREYLKAFHAAEIAYVFGTLDPAQADYGKDDRVLSEILSGYWVNFARSGDPNGNGMPDWPRYTPESEGYLRIGDAVVSGEHLLKEQLDYQSRVMGDR